MSQTLCRVILVLEAMAIVIRCFILQDEEDGHHNIFPVLLLFQCIFNNELYNLLIVILTFQNFIYTFHKIWHIYFTVIFKITDLVFEPGWHIPGADLDDLLEIPRTNLPHSLHCEGEWLHICSTYNKMDVRIASVDSVQPQELL